MVDIGCLAAKGTRTHAHALTPVACCTTVLSGGLKGGGGLPSSRNEAAALYFFIAGHASCLFSQVRPRPRTRCCSPPHSTFSLVAGCTAGGAMMFLNQSLSPIQQQVCASCICRLPCLCLFAAFAFPPFFNLPTLGPPFPFFFVF